MAKLSVVFGILFLVFAVRQSSAAPRLSVILGWTKELFETLLELGEEANVRAFANQVKTNRNYLYDNNLDTDITTNLSRMDTLFKNNNTYSDRDNRIKIQTAIDTFKAGFHLNNNDEYIPAPNALNDLEAEVKKHAPPPPEGEPEYLHHYG